MILWYNQIWVKRHPNLNEIGKAISARKKGEASPKSERDWKSNLGTKKRVKRHPNLNEIGKAISA